MQTLFAPPEQQWHPISPSWRTLELLSTVLTWIILPTIPALILGLGFGLWWISAICWGFGALLIVIRLIMINRQWKAWGYALREDDLYLTQGVMFKRLTVVPYGRMQVVEVTSGPFERKFGVATVKFVTASAETDAAIPGLPAEEAARLRDRLTELGESRATGL